jgi:hypothetical protein
MSRDIQDDNRCILSAIHHLNTGYGDGLTTGVGVLNPWRMPGVQRDLFNNTALVGVSVTLAQW